jgi:hypothetical protein
MPPSLRGELRLAERAGTLTGTLTLENSDAAPLPVTDGHSDAQGAIEFRVPLDGGTRFVGRLDGDQMSGEAFAGRSGLHQWESGRLGEDDEYYAALPRFTLREILFGRADSTIRIPGSWLAAANAGGETPASVVATYQAVARRAAVPALTGDTLALWSLLRLMGVYRRAEMVDVSQRTLEAIRADLPADSVRARLDYLFRPAGTWLVDVHEVALARTRRGHRTITWDSAGPALEAAGLLSGGVPDGSERIPLALYRLLALSRADTSAFASVMQSMKLREPASASAVQALLAGYAEAVDWYGEAMRFFLHQPWFTDARGRHSLADIARRHWGEAARAIPDVGAHLYGYPEGAPHIGMAALVPDLVTAENVAARQWLERHGPEGMLDVVRRLAPPVSAAASVSDGRQVFRVTTVAAEVQHAFNGFLEPRDGILIDPSYMPLVALGTLMHEWQHIIHEHARLRLSGPGRAVVLRQSQVTLVSSDRFIAEGLAEAGSEEVLAPVVARYPLLALGEAEKRASLVGPHSEDPHLVGYLMVRTLGRIVPDRSRRDELLVRHAATPFTLLAEPPVRKAWIRFRARPDRSVPFRADPGLIPETGFTVEDGVPDVTGTHILVGDHAQ